MVQIWHSGAGGRVCGRDGWAEETGFEDVFETRRIISSLSSHRCLSSYILSINQPIQICLGNIIFKALYLGLQNLGRGNTWFCSAKSLQCPVETREIPRMLLIQSRETSQEKQGKVPRWVWRRKAGGIRVRRPGFSPGLSIYMILNKVLIL